MSFYRNIERGLWGDEIIAACSQQAKLLFVYLCCNQHDDLSGIYKLSPTIVAEEIGLDEAAFLAALGELKGRVSYDGGVRVVWVHNMLRKQGRSSRGIGAKHIEHAARQLESLPTTKLKSEMVGYYQRKFCIEIGYLEGEKGYPSVSASVSVSGSVSGSVSSSEGGCGGEAPAPQDDRQRRAALIPLADPIAAAHDRDVSAILQLPSPTGCRRWGPTDIAEIHRQIRAHGVEHVVDVIAFLAESIEQRRRFGEYVTQHKDWSNLWQFDGGPWARWDQRFAEYADKERRIQERQAELKRAEEQPT